MSEPRDPREIFPSIDLRYLLATPATVRFEYDDHGIIFRTHFDPGVKIIDRRSLILLPVHLRPDVDPDDTVLDCCSEVDTELED